MYVCNLGCIANSPNFGLASEPIKLDKWANHVYSLYPLHAEHENPAHFHATDITLYPFPTVFVLPMVFTPLPYLHSSVVSPGTPTVRY